MKKEVKKTKEIYFSEAIDDSIKGMALAFAFILCSIILYLNQNYFTNEIAKNVIRLIFAGIGFLGLSIEISKILQRNEVKGLSDVSTGIFIIIISCIPFVKKTNTFISICLFILLCVGIYSFLIGVISIIYSCYLNFSKTKKKKKSIILFVITKIPTIVALILSLLQIIQIVNNFIEKEQSSEEILCVDAKFNCN